MALTDTQSYISVGTHVGCLLPIQVTEAVTLKETKPKPSQAHLLKKHNIPIPCCPSNNRWQHWVGSNIKQHFPTADSSKLFAIVETVAVKFATR